MQTETERMDKKYDMGREAVEYKMSKEKREWYRGREQVIQDLRSAL